MAVVPKAVVFDLDACCWYPEMYMMQSGAPFKKTGDFNTMVSCKEEAVKLLGMTRGVWALLNASPRFAKTHVCVASRCDEPEWAVDLLKLFEAEPGVTFWNVLGNGERAEIYKGSKRNHFRALQKKTKVAFEDMLFFDDDPANIRDVSGLGVHCVLTPDGVTGAKWEEGLQAYAKAKGGSPYPEPEEVDGPKFKF